MNTIITETTDEGEVSYDVFSKLVDHRILFLYDYIDDKIATDVVATLLYLDQNKEQISLYINSEGGDPRSVFMIYDIMKMVKSPIATYCIGSAMYESLLILAAGTKGLRHATKSSTICLSQLAVGDHRYSNMTDAEILLAQARRSNNSFMEALSENIEKPVKKILKDSERQLFLSASEAKKYGFIDNIIGSNKNEK